MDIYRRLLHDRLPWGQNSGFRPPWSWLIGGGCLVVVLLGILLPRPGHAPASQSRPTNEAPRATDGNRAVFERTRPPRGFVRSERAPDAQEVVAGKVRRFAHDRLGVVRAMAEHYKIEVPKDVERFFAAAEAGRWEEVKSLFDSLNKLRHSDKCTEDLCETP